MRRPIPGPPHLTYCMNVHPGEDWADQVKATTQEALRVREAQPAGQAFGLGLRISASAAAELAANPSMVEAYRDLLRAQDMYAFTVNAFPFGTFHGTRVKDAVYQPDWAQPERAEYTLRVAEVLARLLPEGVQGSLSTAPLTFKGWPAWAARTDEAVRRISLVALRLRELEARTGRRVVLAMEPEPACYPETTPELISVMKHCREEGVRALVASEGLARAEAEDVVTTYVGCCFDTAHQAVEFEQLGQSLAHLRDAGVQVAKVQVSAAIEGDTADDGAMRQLAGMQDDVYLHQVALQSSDGDVRRWSDLPAFLDERHTCPPGVVRVHYHVPLFVERFGALRSTAGLVKAAAPDVLAASGHIEAETYTWAVWKQATGETLPVTTGIARELRWLRDALGMPIDPQAKAP